MTRDVLTVWTIFREPRDAPAGYRFVVRGFDIGPNGASTPHPTAQATGTLDMARRLIPPGLVRWPRDPDDDAVIVESWI